MKLYCIMKLPWHCMLLSMYWNATSIMLVIELSINWPLLRPKLHTSKDQKKFSSELNWQFIIGINGGIIWLCCVFDRGRSIRRGSICKLLQLQISIIDPFGSWKSKLINFYAAFLHLGGHIFDLHLLHLLDDDFGRALERAVVVLWVYASFLSGYIFRLH